MLYMIHLEHLSDTYPPFYGSAINRNYGTFKRLIMEGMININETLLDELSRDKCVLLVPAHLYVAVLMIAGLFGNVLVCYFYVRKTRTTPTTRLILTVAIIDTVQCVFMPMHIVIMCLAYKGVGNIPCKLYIAFQHVTGGLSVFVLVAIAVFRYRAVCRPFSTQCNIRHTNITVLVLVMSSVILTIPLVFTYESMPIEVKAKENVTITGYHCQFTSGFLTIALHGIVFFLFLVSLVIIFIMYSFIGLVIFRQYKKRKQLQTDRPVGKKLDNAISNPTTNVSETALKTETDTISNISFRDNLGKKGNRTSSHSERTISDTANQNIKHGTEGNGANEDDRGGQVGITDAEELGPTSIHDVRVEPSSHVAIPTAVIRQVLMLFVIIVILIISFLPYLVMAISAAVSEFSDDDKYTNWYWLMFRSYLINSAANPFVYGFFNTEFRYFVKRLLCRCM